MALCSTVASPQDVGKQIYENVAELCDNVHPQEFFMRISHLLHRFDAERIEKGLRSDKPEALLNMDIFMVLKRRSRDWPQHIIKALKAMKKTDVLCSLGVPPSEWQAMPRQQFSPNTPFVAMGGAPAFRSFPDPSNNRAENVQRNRGGVMGVYSDKGGSLMSDHDKYWNTGEPSMAKYEGYLNADGTSLDEGYHTYSKGNPSSILEVPIVDNGQGNTGPLVDRNRCDEENSSPTVGESSKGPFILSGDNGAPPPPALFDVTAHIHSSRRRNPALPANPCDAPSRDGQRTEQLPEAQDTGSRRGEPAVYQTHHSPFPSPYASPSSSRSYHEPNSGRANNSPNDLDRRRDFFRLPPPLTNIPLSLEDNKSCDVSYIHETPTAELRDPSPSPETLTSMASLDGEGKTAAFKDREQTRLGQEDVQEDSDLPAHNVQSEQNGESESVLPQAEERTTGCGQRSKRKKKKNKKRPPHTTDIHQGRNVTNVFNINKVSGTFLVSQGHLDYAATPPQLVCSDVNPIVDETGSGVGGVVTRADGAPRDSISPLHAVAMVDPVPCSREGTAVLPQQSDTPRMTEEQTNPHICGSSHQAFSSSVDLGTVSLGGDPTQTGHHCYQTRAKAYQPSGETGREAERCREAFKILSGKRDLVNQGVPNVPKSEEPARSTTNRPGHVPGTVAGTTGNVRSISANNANNTQGNIPAFLTEFHSSWIPAPHSGLLGPSSLEQMENEMKALVSPPQTSTEE